MSAVQEYLALHVKQTEPWSYSYNPSLALILTVEMRHSMAVSDHLARWIMMLYVAMVLQLHAVFAADLNNECASYCFPCSYPKSVWQ